MRQATQGGLKMEFGLGLSFDYERNITYGMLLGCHSLQAAFIITQLKELALLAGHPLLLPTMIMGYQRSFLGDRLLRTRVQMMAVEAVSGQTQWPVTSHNPSFETLDNHIRDIDTKALSRRALGVVQSGTVHQRLMEILSVHVNTALESSAALEPYMRNNDFMISTAKMIDDRLRFLRNKTEFMLPAIRSYKERAHAQMSAVRSPFLMNRQKTLIPSV
jgi:hypothetical protein